MNKSTKLKDEPHTASRPRLWVIATSVVLVSIVGALLTNAAVVDRQSLDAPARATLPLDSGDIYVQQDGPHDAPPLVLIHGLAGSTNWWDSLVPLLTKSHRVIRVDLLGHGRSAKPAGAGYTISEHGRRVGEALDLLDVENATLVGHSTGGSVVTALAEQRPGLVSALALIDTGPSLDAFVSNGIAGQLILTPVVGQLLWRFRTDDQLRRATSTAFSRSGFVVPQQLVDDVTGMTYRAFTATSRAADDYLKQRPLPDRLKPLGKPLLVIFGKEDRRWRSSSSADYRSIPGTKVELISGVGHSPMLESPRRTAETLLDFTARSPG